MKSHNIKNKLEGRRIEVSETSWEMLASQLDANEQQKKRKSFYPYAACLALLVGFIMFMILKTETVEETETIVKTETEATKNPTKVDAQQIVIPIEIEKITIENNVVSTQESTSKVIEDNVVRDKLIAEEKQQLETVLHKELQHTVVVNEKEQLPKKIKTIITEKEVVVVNANEDLKASILALSVAEKIAITDEEIDQLLKEAKQSLQKIAIKKDVDITSFATADELLEEVEFELDKSFKQKVFDLIKSNIQKSRTVIADRN